MPYVRVEAFAVAAVAFEGVYAADTLDEEAVVASRLALEGQTTT